MRRREFYWSLFHTPEKNQLDGLRTDQVEAVFAAIPKAMRGEWLIWRDGFDAWKPFEDFPQLLIRLRQVDAKLVEAPPAPPQLGSAKAATSVAASVAASVAKKTKEKTKSGLTLTGTRAPKGAAQTQAHAHVPARDQDFEMKEPFADLTFMPTANAEDRNNFRFEKVFDVKITMSDKVHMNKTVNISLKGMQLKNPLPKGLPRYINVEIIFKDKVIPVVCTEVRGETTSGSTRLKIEVNDFTPGLLALLLNA